ncbi:hypothetical protein F5Y16DRAFT_94939 [Xylariaceae sp. FL0255]|nr:hypothetical protein F5Y16DRAFT_94939 [Xylariaceae sp. FL0255]
MPAQTRSGGTIKPSSGAPRQLQFPHRRRTVKRTYGRSKAKPRSEPRQETLTQMDFTSSALRFEGDDEPPTKKSTRRKTMGDELEEQSKRSASSKRRKTLGDSPSSSSANSSFHTQTLTQMLSTPADHDPYEFDDSSSPNTPHKPPADPQDADTSAVPSLVQSATPVNRQKRIEIPSSQSPTTPLLLRLSGKPQHSPLVARSTNIAMPSPILKKPGKIPRTAVIPDTYSTTHDSSPVAQSPSSAIKATPSKKLRFDLPDDKENVTPGRTKPKSPKPTPKPRQRQPLLEVPDSDEEPDDDSTVYDSDDEDEDEFGGDDRDSESPTPKRFQNALQSPRLDLAPEEPGEETQAMMLSMSSLSQEKSKATESDSGDLAASEAGRAASPELDLESPANQEIQEDTGPTSTQRPEKSLQRGEPEETQQNRFSMTQGFMYTQGLESQRVPLDAIHALGPQTPRSDIMVSLHPEHIAKIVSRSKDHEFRAWKIPDKVSRIWVYITRPECQLKYMCIFGRPKNPGEIEDEKGIGNAEFNLGKNAAKYAYEILQVYELNNPVSLDEMKAKGWVASAPQKYAFIPPAVVGELTANLRCALFEESASSDQECEVPKSTLSESQELRAQLQSDADYNTQHYSSEVADEVVPSSQSPRNKNAETKCQETFVRPALPRSRSSGLFTASQRPVNAVRPSQATTVSQASSSSPAVSPERSGPHHIITSSQSHETIHSSPARLRRTQSSLRSSQFATRSQMLPDSLLNDDIHEPPPIIWDSADEQSD